MVHEKQSKHYKLYRLTYSSSTVNSKDLPPQPLLILSSQSKSSLYDDITDDAVHGISMDSKYPSGNIQAHLKHIKISESMKEKVLTTKTFKNKKVFIEW